MAKCGTVLVVDDEPMNIQILERVLESEFEVLTASDGPQALELSESARPDLILLDLKMPIMDGFDVCARLKANPSTRHIPVIFLTARVDDDFEAQGLALGAIDYLTKPFRMSLILARVRNHVELKQGRDKLSTMAMIDGLTGLANRRRFDEVLEAEIRRLRRTKAPLSLIILDIDHFKLFNDAYGHVAGDGCLRDVGGSIAASISRPADVAARYGGEEFACILPDTLHDGALAVAHTIHRGIDELAIPHAKSFAGHVTASIGLITMLCTNELDPAGCVAAADKQLYLAKENGRNRIVALDQY